MFNNKKIRELNFVVNSLRERISYLEKHQQEQIKKIIELNKKYADLLAEGQAKTWTTRNES